MVGLPLLLVTFTLCAGAVHVARYWRPLGFVASVVATWVCVWGVANGTAAPLDLLGVSFQFQPLARDYLLAAMALSGALAIATSFGDTRRHLGFLLWSWIPWLVALLVNDFVIGVFAWATGLAAMVIAMEPRRAQRVRGAAFYLVLVIVGTAFLLVGHRFVQLYPLTPDQVSLLESSVLFLTWGFGLLLAIVPFFFWLGPTGDETPLPIIAVLLGLGQPLGLWLLYGLVGQYPRLLELSNLLVIMGYGGAAAVLVGGGLCFLERRAGRLMGYAGLLALGFILLDLSRGTLEGTTNAVLETFARALGLALMAASLTIARTLENRWVNYLAILVFILGALTLAGLTPGIALVSRWNLLLELEATDARLFYVTMLATLGVLIGTARHVLLWLQLLEPQASGEPEFIPTEIAPEKPQPLLRRALARVRAFLRGLALRVGRRFPPPLKRGARTFAREWRALASIVLLTLLGLFLLYYSVTPNLWFERALETVGQLPFIR